MNRHGPQARQINGDTQLDDIGDSAGDPLSKA
jgi:hypothetical protein